MTHSVAIRSGVRYRLRNGEEVGPLRRDEGGYWWKPVDRASPCWTSDGEFWLPPLKDNPRDIVAEILE